MKKSLMYNYIIIDGAIFIFLRYISAAVYVEGDIETRVYNDAIDGQVRSIPEICLRHDGMLIQHSEEDLW